MLKNDEQMLLRLRKPTDVSEEMINLLKEYFNKKKCAYSAKLSLITICDKDTQQPLEEEHYCVIIKPKDKYNLDKDNFNIFKIIDPFLDNKNDFVDFSILGWLKTMQIYDDENSLLIYSSY